MSPSDPATSSLEAVDNRQGWAASPAIRRTMQGNHRRDTTPELRIRHLLHRRGLRYLVDWPLPFDRRKRADVVFTKARVVVFVDGCFWHGCPTHYVKPRANAEFWEAKITGNQARDLEVTTALKAAGWTVIRVWEHEPAERAADEIECLVRHGR